MDQFSHEHNEEEQQREPEPPFNGWACRSCLFWKQDMEVPSEMELEIGECRRYPPQILFGLNDRSFEWPIMRGDENCGEFKDKNQHNDPKTNFLRDLGID